MRAIILLALLGTALAVPKSTTRIVGGSPTTIQTYPYMANMQYAWFGWWYLQSCGGSLIRTTTILSAAHCYEDDWASEWRVVLGTTFRSSGGTPYAVTRITLHPEYEVASPLDADIALVYLSTPAVLSNTVATIPIVSSTSNLPDGTVVTAIGWGDLEYDGSPPEQLQHVQINVINQELCAARYAFLKSQPGYQLWPDITPGMFCAGILDVGGRDACQGDSGGPIAYLGNQDVQVGVTSWGYGCADPVYPGVLARVSYYSNWIATNA